MVEEMMTIRLISGEAGKSMNYANLALNCPHDYINPEGVCTACGIVCQQIYGNEGPIYFNTRANEKSILKDMESFDLSDDIKNKAEEIFGKLNSATKRGNRRKQLIFFCIYNAYNEVGNPQDPKRIAEMVGIRTSEMTKALSMFSEAQTGYKPPSIHVNALHFLPQYCNDLNLTEDTTNEILNFAQKILDRDPDLKETFPQKVAAGILSYYAKINGITIDKRFYSKMVQLSDVTINNMRKYIEKLDNLNA